MIFDDYLRLKAPLAPVMEEKRVTVAALHEAVNAEPAVRRLDWHQGRPWSKATIGHYRKSTDWRVHPDLAARIAAALDAEVDDLFEAA